MTDVRSPSLVIGQSGRPADWGVCVNPAAAAISASCSIAMTSPFLFGNVLAAMLSGIERQLLRHYSERDRVISGTQRSAQHRRLVALGYIREQSLITQDALKIIVTPAGHAALEDDPGAA